MQRGSFLQLYTYAIKVSRVSAGPVYSHSREHGDYMYPDCVHYIVSECLKVATLRITSSSAMQMEMCETLVGLLKPAPRLVLAIVQLCTCIRNAPGGTFNPSPGSQPVQPQAAPWSLVRGLYTYSTTHVHLAPRWAAPHLTRHFNLLAIRTVTALKRHKRSNVYGTDRH